MLDAETWEEKAVIPLDIGRRFFRVKGEHEPLPAFGEEVRCWHDYTAVCSLVSLPRV